MSGPALQLADTGPASADVAVERSVSGRSWRLKPHDPALALALSQRHGLPEMIGRILAGRGIGVDDAQAFIAPKIQTLLPDPSHLHDLDRAVTRLADAVAARETVGILGDYDVDGATSTALLARYLRTVGCPVVIDIPDRLAEGYGPNPAAIERLRSAGSRLIVTLDCGTTAFEPLAHAADLGLDVIVVDHHVADEALPRAVAVVNPNRRDQTSGIGDLAAVGVVFTLVVGLNRLLRERGWFESRPEPDLRCWLDLVALGTVCDVVPLGGLNRALVRAGLKVLAKGHNPGLRALASVAGLAGSPSFENLGFLLGPRINAGGRVGESSLGAHLLLDDRPDEVHRIAQQLHQLNDSRRARQRAVVEAAEAAITGQLEAGLPLLAVAGPGWSPGVVGLAASRLVERHGRPALVAGIEDGMAKGSGRSIPGFDLGSAVLEARREGLLATGGGHPMAAGFSLEAGRFERLHEFLLERYRAACGDRPPPRPPLELDGSLRVGGASYALASTLEALAPFGRDNPEPLFMLPAVRLADARRIGQQHVACWLSDPSGRGLRGLAFRSVQEPLGDLLLKSAGARVHLAGRVRLDQFQDRRQITFQIEDAAVP
ncbi:MAG: single-stranded-DNA-specific exonuclease RecJ [Geminicoccaceae bacterium]|nr:single-stranded-DNA-specific exonuclease RecJ [Geminicoccaceae bacterium]